MSPRFYTLLIAGVLLAPGGLAPAQQKDQPPKQEAPDKPKQPEPPKEAEPPEEDEGAKPKEYAFNPLQAQKEITVGEFYMHRKSFTAAAGRFTEATRWNPGLADAYLKLAEADEKLNDRKGAKQAYSKYLELAPDAKNAAAIKKKIEKM
jgi:tetratricopeptide (TPR) repeat protein